MSSLKVVVVNAELPYPTTAGNRIRTFNLLRRLASGHQITFIARRGQQPETDEAVAVLGDLGIRTVIVDESVPAKSGPAFYARLTANLLSPHPYSVTSHGKRGIRRAVAAYAAANRVDLWQAEWPPYFRALQDAGGTPKLVMAHNVESQLWQRYYESERHPLKRLYIREQWRKYRRFECSVFAAATRIVAVSAEDARLIREEFGGIDVDVIDNGVDRKFFESVQPNRDPNQILFLGGFDWRPNLDATALLLDRIFPAVRADLPAARLVLVGRKPPSSLQKRVQGMAGVELHADVPDIRPYLARSGVMAVPLRIGGGSRLKILEAVATGLPVVSTRIGAEGLELTAGRDYVAADAPEMMAQELSACIRDPEPARAIAERCRSFVLQRYDWDTLASKLEEVWLKCATRVSHAGETSR
jgi:glycosyltransferase involved in cell wall biosynthesis